MIKYPGTNNDHFFLKSIAGCPGNPGHFTMFFCSIVLSGAVPGKLLWVVSTQPLHLKGVVSRHCQDLLKRPGLLNMLSLSKPG